ncbi:MAG: CHRD domain-containing protein [Solirubrobacteraceae bacterium]
MVLALVAVGCGSGSSSGRPPPPSSGLSAAATSAPRRVYRVTLTGKSETPAGAANGSGAAVIAIHRGSVVCWRFAHLHGFLNATVAHIHIGPQGRSGAVVVPLSMGPRLHHRGCVQASAETVTAIERHPSSYYVNIHSVKYPAGAVRAQL